MTSTVVFSLVLLAVSAGLVLSQRRARQALVDSPRSASERDFSLGQIRRRMHTAGLIALLAVAILLGDWITSPLWALVFWCLIASLVLWVVYLALVDVKATRRHFAQLISDHREEQARWHSETVRRAEEQRTNGTGGNGHNPAAHDMN